MAVAVSKVPDDAFGYFCNPFVIIFFFITNFKIEEIGEIRHLAVLFANNNSQL